MQSKPYAQLLGSLMYLAIATRPDIAYTVGVLARFTSNPGKAHQRALQHLCHYLQETKNVKLCYSPDSSTSELFTTYSDADLGGNPDNARSTSGMVHQENATSNSTIEPQLKQVCRMRDDDSNIAPQMTIGDYR